MRISASTTGLYPVPVRATRNPAAQTAGTDAASSVSTATDKAARQLVPVAAPVAPIDVPRDLISAPSRARETNLETSAAAGSVRGRSDLEGLNTIGLARQFGRALGSRSAPSSSEYSALRGAAEYAQVATQEHRDELVALLGIDVFA